MRIHGTHQAPPVHVEVVLPDHVWQRMKLTATARGATVAGLLAEVVVQYLAKERAGNPMDAILHALDDVLAEQRIAGQELVDELDALLTLGATPREICEQLQRSPGALVKAAHRAHRPDLEAPFAALDRERRHVA